jgi:hypothetical protein
VKIYLAARYSRLPEKGYAKALVALGHTVTSRWILGGHDLGTHDPADAAHALPLWASEDMEDLLAADLCLSFTEPPEAGLGRARGGRHVELGIALALGKRCLIVGYREHIFHWLACMELYPTWEACLARLQEEQPR